MQKVKELPFVTTEKPVSALDGQFMVENASKQMVFTDSELLATSLITEFFDKWKDLTEFYKQIPVGVTAETVSTSTGSTTGKDQVALNNDDSLYNISGNSADTSSNSTIQTKNFSEYRKFVLSPNFYDIIKANIRNYIFINIY